MAVGQVIDPSGVRPTRQVTSLHRLVPQLSEVIQRVGTVQQLARLTVGGDALVQRLVEYGDREATLQLTLGDVLQLSGLGLPV